MNGETNELDDVCTILICHCPEVLDTSLELYQFDLVLSGHAHGGQVRIGSQGLWSTSQGFLPKYTSGVNQMGGGVAGGHQPRPRRFGAVPAHLQPAGTGGRGCELSHGEGQDRNVRTNGCI